MVPWQNDLRHSIRSVKELQDFVHLEVEEARLLEDVVKHFPLQVPRYYLDLIDVNDPHDPIKELVIPSTLELNREGYLDTSGEHDSTKVRGLQHKYRSTALLLMNSVCASYCRYCFRKRLMDRTQPNDETLRDYEAAAEYIRQHPEINNVLLSGGDPLLLSNEKLDCILGLLRQIDSLKIIRIGTKVPAFLPSRMTTDPGLLEVIARHSHADKRLYVITHFDHPRELTPHAVEGLNLLMQAGAILANQAVLLRRINDSAEVLEDLFNRLSYCGATPYYLFQCRPVKGSRHSQIPLAEGYALFEQAKVGMAGLAKRARYAMSHYTGKIEIVAIKPVNGGQEIFLKYHQARNPEDLGRVLTLALPSGACWLDDLLPQLQLVEAVAVEGNGHPSDFQCQW
jgi:lysine 2,3-aminomutase